MRFVCEPEIRKNDLGKIQSVKVRWNEAHSITEWAIEGLGKQLFYFGLIAFGLSFLPAVAFQMSGFVLAGLVIMALSIACAIGLWRTIPIMSGKERLLVFLRDGRMRAPLGLARGRFSKDESRHPHTGLVSIEARPVVRAAAGATEKYAYGVCLFYRNGHTVTVAEHLTQDDAHCLRWCS